MYQWKITFSIKSIIIIIIIVIIIIVFSLIALSNQHTVDHRKAKKQFPFSMAIENEENMHECSLEHLRMGTVRFK